MRTLLLNSGVSLLQQQAAAPSQKLRVYGFRLGGRVATQANMEAWDDVELALGAMTGPIILTADDSYIRYERVGPQAGKLVLTVPEDVPEMSIANVTIYAGLSEATAVPLTFSAASDGFVKLQTQAGAPGYAWWFHLMLELPNLEDRFAFDNLGVRYAEFAAVASENDLDTPWTTLHDQLMLDQHTATGNPNAVLNVGYRFWGCPLMQAQDPSQKALVLTGGAHGDGYGGSELPRLGEGYFPPDSPLPSLLTPQNVEDVLPYLPTSLPSVPGKPWNNGGSLAWS